MKTTLNQRIVSMHINGSLNEKTHEINLHYDADSQAALSKAWPLVRRTLHSPLVKKVLGQQGHVLRPRMEAASKVLQDLATAKVREYRLPMLDLTATAELVMFVADYRAKIGERVATLPETVLLLSRVTPYVLPMLLLPPAAEVFDRSEAESPAWNSFELVRLNGKVRPPTLTLMEMYELWLVLQQNRRNNGQIRALETCLELATRLFRDCLRSLATADLLTSIVRSGVNGRQS